MRVIALLLFGVVGCAGEETGNAIGDAEREIEFLVPGTLEPMPADTAIDVYLRAQGAYGCEIDIRVYGVGIGDAQSFSIGFVGTSDRPLAEQRFLPTSTAEELQDGSFAIAELPVVFFEDVAQSDVDGAPATLRAIMMTSPPTAGELDVLLALQP
jgi:hypothetical protein